MKDRFKACDNLCDSQQIVRLDRWGTESEKDAADSDGLNWI